MKSTKTNRSAFEGPVIDSPLVQVVLVVDALPVCMTFQPTSECFHVDLHRLISGCEANLDSHSGLSLNRILAIA